MLVVLKSFFRIQGNRKLPDKRAFRAGCVGGAGRKNFVAAGSFFGFVYDPCFIFNGFLKMPL